MKEKSDLSRTWMQCVGGVLLQVLLLGAPGAQATMPDLDQLSGVRGTVPASTLSFDQLYQQNLRLGIGDYITFDLLAHSFVRLWRDSLQHYESERLEPGLREVIELGLQALQEQDVEAPETVANRDYFSVAAGIVVR